MSSISNKYVCKKHSNSTYNQSTRFSTSKYRPQFGPSLCSMRSILIGSMGCACIPLSHVHAGWPSFLDRTSRILSQLILVFCEGTQEHDSDAAESYSALGSDSAWNTQWSSLSSSVVVGLFLCLLRWLYVYIPRTRVKGET